MTTEIVRIDPSNFSRDELASAADLIKRGGLVVFPTETVYGLGADATDPVAAMRIYEAKGRPSDNPLIIHIADPADAERYTYTSPVYYELARLFMPGPLTVIMRSRDTVPRQTRGGLDTVAVRCPAHPIATALIREAGVAIAAPSANLSGSPSPTCAEHVIRDMNGRIDAIIDGGDCEIGLESTIVKLEDNKLILLRPGAITADALHCVCENVEISASVTEMLREDERPLSPGMKYRHYAPSIPLVLLEGDEDRVVAFMRRAQNAEKCTILCYHEESYELRGERLIDIGARDDLSEQAHRLFAALRDADELDCDVIYAHLPKKEGIGLALYNRLIRAAAHTVKHV